GRSLVTREGEWVGRDWLRVSRGADPRAGVLGREHRLKGLRAAVTAADAQLAQAESELAAARAQLAQAEERREQAQAALQGAQQKHAGLIGLLEAGRAHAEESSLRGERLRQDAGAVTHERAVTEEALARAAAELAGARGALEEADAALRSLDEQRLAAERRVSAAREAMEAARLAAQETHVRRAALAEQFAQTRCQLPEVLANLDAAASVPAWEQSLEEARAEIERLGQVNLAAIDELKEQTQRQEYLDSQFADLTSALATLDEAMRRIDKETRTRFQDTFERINSGLRDKFPRLFGGGHAYLELVGEDKL